MMQGFKNILIPVDFSINTEVAIAKSLEMIDTGPSNIHLLHVNRSNEKTKEKPQVTNDQKLNQWKTTIEETLPSTTVHCWIRNPGSVQESIRQMAKELGADLIVIGKNSRHNWLPVFNSVTPIKLAEMTDVPVLTVKPGALHKRIRTVVVPVSDTVPLNKMHLLEVLCNRGKLKVHLITFGNGQHYQSAAALLQVYQWLRSSIKCPVEYSLVNGYNKARTILDFAEKVNADIMLVYPDSETKISWLNTHLPDVISPASKMLVLAVQPPSHTKHSL